MMSIFYSVHPQCLTPTNNKITVWIDKMVEGKMEGTAAGLLDECVLDDSDACENFSKALSKLDGLLGVGAGEQF
jgi:hypothetical protein